MLDRGGDDEKCAMKPWPRSNPHCEWISSTYSRSQSHHLLGERLVISTHARAISSSHLIMSFRTVARTTATPLWRHAAVTKFTIAVAHRVLVVASAASPQQQRHLPALALQRSFTASTVALRRPLDPKWEQAKPVTYDELKPITNSPDDVSAPALSRVSREPQCADENVPAPPTHSRS